MKFYSPLRYPGGKKRLKDFFKEIIKENFLGGGTYVEPYGGGSSIALNLLFEGHVSKIIINDLDRSIYAFWHSVLFQTEELCNLIRKTPLNVKTWKKQKRIQLEKEKNSLLELGFSTLFLNRTNRSGVLKAGVIGGLNQDGDWKIDCRFHKKDLIEKIRKVASHKKQIEVYNEDAIQLLVRISKKLPKKSLIYLDPPYYVKGKDLYMNHYGPEEHKEVALGIKKIRRRWIVTYDAVPQIERLYKGYRKEKYLLTYTIGNTGKGKEVIFFSRGIKKRKSVLKLPNLLSV